MADKKKPTGPLDPPEDKPILMQTGGKHTQILVKTDTKKDDA